MHEWSMDTGGCGRLTLSPLRARRREEPPDQITAAEMVPLLQREILADKPRVTRSVLRGFGGTCARAAWGLNPVGSLWYFPRHDTIKVHHRLG